MALPWSAPTLGMGILPAQAPFPGPAAVDPRLIALITADRQRQQEQTQKSLEGLTVSLADMMHQRQQDAIASQLLAGSAPKAEAVGGQAPAAQPVPAAVDPAYAERGLDLSPTGQPIAPATPPASLASFKPVGAGVPSTALTAAEAAHNAALGYPAQQLMSPRDIYAAQQSEYDKHLSDMYKQAQIGHLNRLGYGTGGAGGLTADRYVTVQSPTGETFKVTGNEAAKLTTGGTGFAGAAETARGWEKPDGTFTNKPEDVGLPPETDAATQGTSVKVQFPRAKSPTVLPAGTWDSLKGGAGWKVLGGVTGGGGAVGQNQGGYVAGQRYGGRLYRGGDPFDEKNWQ